MLLFDIHQFNQKVGLIDDMKWLINKKETIENELMGDVSWEVRIILYQQVQLINKRINELKQIAIS